VSGAASGIDSVAMDGALGEGMPAVGILGGGVDVVYPAANRALYRRSEENGCLISEYPPGSRPFPGNFLQRNRIISGLSSGVLVVEAPERSGALNTARHASSQGRDLFVVPGNLGVDTCRGSNVLLQEGAYAVLCGWDVVKHYENLYPGAVKNRPATLAKTPENPLPQVAQAQVLPEKPASSKGTPSKNPIDNGVKSTYSVIKQRPADLSDQEKAVLEQLCDQPQLPDSILDAVNLPSGTVQSILTRLAIKGLTRYLPDGRISLK
jgi:DNA processing protein